MLLQTSLSGYAWLYRTRCSCCLLWRFTPVVCANLLQWTALTVITGECLACKVRRFDVPLCRDVLIALSPQFHNSSTLYVQPADCNILQCKLYRPSLRSVHVLLIPLRTLRHILVNSLWHMQCMYVRITCIRWLNNEVAEWSIQYNRLGTYTYYYSVSSVCDGTVQLCSFRMFCLQC